MNTDDLIDSLTKDVKPMPRHALRRRLIAGLILGGGGTLLAVGVWLGFRPDLWIAMHGGAFWMKWLYTASLALCATLATARLGRPDGGALGWLWIMALPVAGLAAISIAEMAKTPS